MIIDSDNCTNVASFIMVKRLNLNTIKYEIPYQLQWLNDNSVVKMNRHMLIPLSLDMYKDKVLCDVIPKLANHLLLRRLWQFDRKAKYDGFKNMYYVENDGRIDTLAPLTHVLDQLKLKQEEASESIQIENYSEIVRNSENKASHELEN